MMSDFDPLSSASSPAKADQALNINGETVNIEGDVVGGDKYVGLTAEQVNLLLTRIQTEYRPKPFDGRSPYLGLDTFQERDADKFFGRETLIADLVARIATSAVSNARAVFVAGPSGSGKSSLVRAGLVPALKQGRVTGSESWLYETLKPGREPLAKLRQVVESFAGKLEAGDDFIQHAWTDPTRLDRWINIALHDETARRALIVIDQFEEIFTQLTTPAQEKERAAFLKLLTYGATVENGRMVLIFTLRSDFVTNCASYLDLNALVNQQFLQVGAMSPDELVSAIARPALQVGLRLDPALVSQVVNDVRGEPGALPLMQFALKDLFDAEKDKGELTLDGYLARGGLRKALERHADAQFAKLDETEQQLARSVFSGLIEIGRGHEDTKRTANFQDLVPAGTDAATVQALVRDLADARLITTDQQGDKEVVTLAHERLITAWAWLQRLVDENREAIALQNEIAQDAGEWAQSGREESYLYRGARLATAQEKLQQEQLRLSGLAREFIDTALEARQAERAEREAARQRELDQARALAAEQQKRAEEEQAANARLRNLFRVIAGVSVVAVIAAIGAIIFLTRSLAETQRADEQTRVSESRRLAQAANQRTDDPDLALLLAMEAVHASDSVEALNAFLGAISAHAVTTWRGHTEPIKNATFTSGDTVVSAGEDNTIRLWDVASGSQRVENVDFTISSMAFNPARNILAVGGCGKKDGFCKAGELRLWQVRDSNLLPLASIPIESTEITGVTFSPDGATLVSMGADGKIQLWNVTEPDHIVLLSKLESLIRSLTGLAFSPNGKLLAIGSQSDGLVGLLDTSDVSQSTLLATLRFPATSLAFSSDSSTLATGDEGGAIQLWNLNDPQNISKLGSPLKGLGFLVTALAFSGDGATLAAASEGQTIWLWDVRDVSNPKLVADSLIGHSKSVSSVAFSPDSKLIVSAGADNTIRLWQVANAWQNGETLTTAGGTFQSIAFSPNGDMLAASAIDYDYARPVSLWDVSDPSHPKTADGQSIQELDLPWSVAYSPDGGTVATGNYFTGIHLWDVATRSKKKNLPIDHGGFVYALAFEPTAGKLLAAGSCATDDVGKNCAEGELGIWDVETMQKIRAWKAHQGAVHTIAFSPDGKTIASGGCGAKNQNGNCTKGEIILWDVATGTPIKKIDAHSSTVWAIAFDRKGDRFASGSQDTTIRLWDASGNMVGVPFKGHTAAVNSVAFSSDGTLLASTADDGTTRLWNVSTQKLLAPPLKANKQVPFSVLFRPVGQTLATMSAETIRLWDIAALNLEQAKWLEIGCRIVNRNLTRAEWARYVNDDPSLYDTKYLAKPTCPQPLNAQDTGGKEGGASLYRYAVALWTCPTCQPFTIPENCGDPVFYTVQEGDELYRIAVNAGTSPQWIINANNLQGETLAPGMTLTIPCSGYVNYAPNVQTPTPGETNIVTATPVLIVTGTPVPPVTGTPAPQVDSTIRMSGGRFRPQRRTVTVGTTVIWTNAEAPGGPAYSVTSGIDGNANGMMNSGLIPAGATFSFTFTVPGNYAYFSETNPTGMTGEIVVLP